jgi:hypothetical protein
MVHGCGKAVDLCMNVDLCVNENENENENGIYPSIEAELGGYGRADLIYDTCRNRLAII